MMDHSLRYTTGYFFFFTLFARISGGFLGIPDFLETGVCIEVPSMKNFDPQKYQGLWFDIRRVPNEYQEAYGCISQNYTWTGSVIDVISRGITTERDESVQVATMTPEEDKALMYVDAEGVPRAPYQVIWTDYISTACVYSCMDYASMFRIMFMWILSRTESPSEKSIQTCMTIFTAYEIDVSKFMVVEQGETCDYGNDARQDKITSLKFLEEMRSDGINNEIENMTDESVWKTLVFETTQDVKDYFDKTTSNAKATEEVFTKPPYLPNLIDAKWAEIESFPDPVENAAERSQHEVVMMFTVLFLALLKGYVTVTMKTPLT